MSDQLITDHGARADGSDATTAIQAAIDAAAAAGGGRVVVPAGRRFRCRRLHLRSAIEFHLEGGSALECIVDHADYTRDPRFWFHAQGAHDLSITGTGTLDGRGEAFMREHGRYIHVGRFERPMAMAFEDCRHLRIRDIRIVNSPDWAMRPIGCEDVVISGVTILNSLKIPNCDGIDIDHSRRVCISDCHIESADDSICIKTRGEYANYGPVEDVLVSNCTLISTSCAVKIGTETCQDIRRVLFSNCTIRGTNRAIGICHRDAGTLSDISFDHLAIETRLFHDKWWGKAEPIYLTSVPRTHGAALGACERIRFRSITAVAENGCFVMGSAANRPRDVLFESVDLTWRRATTWPLGAYDIRPCPPETVPVGGVPEGERTDWGMVNRRPNAGVYLEQADDVRFRGCRVRWQDAAGHPELGPGVEAWDCRDLDLSGIDAPAPRTGVPARLVDGVVG